MLLASTMSEADAEAERDLPRVAVECRGDARAAQAWNRIAVAADRRHARHRIAGQELVAGGDILPVGEVPRMEPDRVAVAARCPDQARVEQSIARLIEIGARRLELEGLAAIGQGRDRGDLAAAQRMRVIERARQRPARRALAAG